MDSRQKGSQDIMILSASRRTDIPCYYSEWFMNRLSEGYVLTKNPMNPSQVRRITLSPEEIDCIVFWTKDPQNMLHRLPQLDDMGYHYYFQFTLNPYGRDIERNLRDKKEILQTFRQLSDRLGKERILWRYDPILINDAYSLDYHIKNYKMLCKELQGYTDICTISFVDIYQKLNKKVKENVLKPIGEEQMHRMASEIAGIGSRYRIVPRACCERTDFSNDGIMPASCIDKATVESACGHAVQIRKDNNQRQGCDCYQSVDIGAYNTCGNGCVYCYANHSDAVIQRNMSLHDPNSEILIR